MFRLSFTAPQPPRNKMAIRNLGKQQLLQRMHQAVQGQLQGSALGRMHWTPPTIQNVPLQQQAEAAATFNGRVQPQILPLLQTGAFLAGANQLIQTDMVNKWTAGTRDAKQRARLNVRDYLISVGLYDTFFPAAHLPPPANTESHRRHQERALSSYALLRIMQGQTCAGALQYVSHVRTWYNTLWEQPFGNVGTQAHPSTTSQFVTSLKKYFPDHATDDDNRLPVTWLMVTQFVTASRQERRPDMGVLIAVCYAGLYRMGEMTSTTASPFNAATEVTEDDLHFLPSFWNADRVVIHLGATKADQFGVKARFNQRMLPVDSNKDFCPGHLLRSMLAHRHKVEHGSEPHLHNTPLFQDNIGAQLKRATTITFMRRTLRNLNYPNEQIMRISGHSPRIGGATALFQIRADPEVFKRLGGWCSDAYRTYIRVRQRDLMEYARDICK